MTLAELYDVLCETNLPVAYRSWSDEDGDRPSLPFITYYEAYSNNFFADDKVYLAVRHVQIELYTAKKDLASEALVQEALDDADLPWQKTETFLDSERCYQIIYEVEV